MLLMGLLGSRPRAILPRECCADAPGTDPATGGISVQLIGRHAPTAACFILAASLAGCATAPAGLPGPNYLAAPPRAEAAETPDPFEDLNRKVFACNQAFNEAVVYPIAKAYREDVPESVRDRVEAFTTNLSEPMVFANTVLQLRLDAAATTLSRFVTN